MRRMTGFLSAMTLSAVGAAQSPPDPLEACVRKTDDSARLACFDQEMQRRHSHTAPAEAVPQHAASPTHPANPVETANPGSAALALPRDTLHTYRKDRVVKEQPKPITATIIRSSSSPDHRYTIELDNGQVWEQVATQQGFYLDTREPVTISAGALGSFFLENSKRQYIRVRRLQ